MRKILYTGLELPPDLDADHCPLIHIVPRAKEAPAVQAALAALTKYTHLIFTSKTAVEIFFAYAAEVGPKQCIAVGKKTAARLRSHGMEKVLTAKTETAEGVIEVLEGQQLDQAHVFWPHSSLSRPVIKNWLAEKGILYSDCVFYDTETVQPPPQIDLSLYEEIVFTSPSTVQAFLDIFGALPKDKTCKCLGPVTEKFLFL